MYDELWRFTDLCLVFPRSLESVLSIAHFIVKIGSVSKVNIFFSKILVKTSTCPEKRSLFAKNSNAFACSPLSALSLSVQSNAVRRYDKAKMGSQILFLPDEIKPLLFRCLFVLHISTAMSVRQMKVQS